MLLIALISVLLLLLNSETQASNCTTPNGETADCIPIFSCEPFLSVIKNANNETQNFLLQSACGNLMVCCGTATNFIVKQPKTKPSSKNWRPLASRKICGFQHTDDRYYNKPITAIDEFPWLAQLRYNSSTGEITDSCAGSLINRRYVLTAAHCTMQLHLTLHNIRLGEYDKLKDTDCDDNPDYPDCAEPVIDLDIESIIRHPSYDIRVTKHDIALIRMSKNVQFSDYVRPICLPSYGYRNASEGDELVTSGWGLTEFAGNSSRIKKRNTNKVVSLEKCREEYKEFSGVNFDKYYLCGLEQDRQSTCQGDSGGPAMTKINHQWQQDGVVSFGKSCGKPGAIIVNANVAEYMDWIIANIKPF